MGYSILYKEHNPTRFNHKKNATQVHLNGRGFWTVQAPICHVQGLGFRGLGFGFWVAGLDFTAFARGDRAILGSMVLSHAFEQLRSLVWKILRSTPSKLRVPNSQVPKYGVHEPKSRSSEIPHPSIYSYEPFMGTKWCLDP